MLSIKSLTMILALVAPTIAAESGLRARELNVCDTLKSCSLVNIKTRNETILDGYDSFEIDASNEQGYTIRCDVNGVNDLHFIRFKYNNYTQEEFGLPRYMFGDAGQGTFLNKVDYLSTCGRKYLTVEGHVWTKKCFTKKFTINVKNPKGKRCMSAPASKPVKAPVSAPVKIPASTPVKTPVKAPVKAPAASAPVKTPVKAPVKAPVAAPTTSSTAAPTKSPKMPPVTAPVTPPTAGCKPEISSFTLVDADLHNDIMPLADFTKKEGLLNIRANVAVCMPEVVDSVKIVLDGKSRCERNAPYAAFGDSSLTDISNDAAEYSGEIIKAGSHVITATPYTGTKCDGIAGETYIQEFKVL